MTLTNSPHKGTRIMWRVWAKALGQKGSECSKESDAIAWVRTVIFFSYLVTNVFIISGVIRHWDSDKRPVCVKQVR